MARQIAETIIAQMGGYGRLHAMVGVTQFVHDEKGTVSFRFKGSRKANHVEIALDPTDTYRMTFRKVRGLDFKEVKTFAGVYCDQLKEIFESTTGLYLTI